MTLSYALVRSFTNGSYHSSATHYLSFRCSQPRLPRLPSPFLLFALMVWCCGFLGPLSHITQGFTWKPPKDPLPEKAPRRSKYKTILSFSGVPRRVLTQYPGRDFFSFQKANTIGPHSRDLIGIRDGPLMSPTMEMPSPPAGGAPSRAHRWLRHNTGCRACTLTPTPLIGTAARSRLAIIRCCPLACSFFHGAAPVLPRPPRYMACPSSGSCNASRGGRQRGGC